MKIFTNNIILQQYKILITFFFSFVRETLELTVPLATRVAL